MAKDDCGNNVNKRFGENICCGVGRGHFALPNTAWRGMIVERLYIKVAMRILPLVSARGILRCQMGDGGG